jgi:hypothetical protein
MPLATPIPIAYKEANVWEITGFTATLPRAPGEPPTMAITFAIGYHDGQSVAWHETQTVGVEPAALVAVMQSPPVGASLYAALKTAMYAYLQQAGHIPEEASE